jgi:hypothetical protein
MATGWGFGGQLSDGFLSGATVLNVGEWNRSTVANVPTTATTSSGGGSSSGGGTSNLPPVVEINAVTGEKPQFLKVLELLHQLHQYLVLEQGLWRVVIQKLTLTSH